MNGLCNCDQGRKPCDCGRMQEPPMTLPDYVINIICACVLAWVVWQAVP